MATIANYAVPTGGFLEEWMEDNNINAAEMARMLGMSRKHMSELLKGKAPVTHELANTLARVTGVKASWWNRMEAGYRDDLIYLDMLKVWEAQWPEAKLFPLKYLRDQRIIKTDSWDKGGQVRYLLQFLQVASLKAFHDTWTHSNIAYRRVAVKEKPNYHLITWLIIGERHAQAQKDLPAYSKRELKKILPDLRALTLLEPLEGVRRAIDLLASVGVVLCLVPAVPGLGVYGATRWLKERPVIQLSLRGKTDDQLWFTLFHEIGHVLLHHKRGLYVLDQPNATNADAEGEANAFAANFLVPEEYQARLPKNRSHATIRQLAEELGIAPSIVLGQAQRLTGDYRWGHNLKQKADIQIYFDLRELHLLSSEEAKTGIPPERHWSPSTWREVVAPNLWPEYVRDEYPDVRDSWESPIQDD